MLGFDAIARLPLATPSLTFSPSPPPVVLGNPINNIWRGVQGTGYCASITLQLITVGTPSNPSLERAAPTLQINSFDLMHERGGLL